MRLLAAAALAALLLPSSAADRFVTVAPGVRLFVHEVGRGTPVVVVHGGPGLDMNYLVDDLAPLAARHRLIFFDQRGGGRSTVTSDVTAALLVADLDALREQLGLSQLTLLGHSWGAGLAALYAIAHPDRVARMVLADAIPPRAVYLQEFMRILKGRLHPDEQAALAEAETAERQARTDQEIVAACRQYWGILAKAYFADRAAAEHSRARLCDAPPAALDNVSHVNEAVLEDLGDYDWRPSLGALTMPVLVIHGDRDPVPLDAAREWAAALPNAQLVVLPDSGHMSYVEQPERFFDAVNAFLAAGR